MPSGEIYSLVNTSRARPEQYDVFLNGREVAYFRLRHGEFSAYCSNKGVNVVYEAKTTGHGAFDDSERDTHLCNAVAKVSEWLANNGN